MLNYLFKWSVHIKKNTGTQYEGLSLAKFLGKTICL